MLFWQILIEWVYNRANLCHIKFSWPVLIKKIKFLPNSGNRPAFKRIGKTSDIRCQGQTKPFHAGDRVPDKLSQRGFVFYREARLASIIDLSSGNNNNDAIFAPSWPKIYSMIMCAPPWSRMVGALHTIPMNLP
jgi:hypothetical protein